MAEHGGAQGPRKPRRLPGHHFATLSAGNRVVLGLWDRPFSRKMINLAAFTWVCLKMFNEIAIFHRDNDQQNHWAQWGTLFSDTPTCFCHFCHSFFFWFIWAFRKWFSLIFSRRFLRPSLRIMFETVHTWFFWRTLGDGSYWEPNSPGSTCRTWWSFVLFSQSSWKVKFRTEKNIDWWWSSRDPNQLKQLI